MVKGRLLCSSARVGLGGRHRCAICTHTYFWWNDRNVGKSYTQKHLCVQLGQSRYMPGSASCFGEAPGMQRRAAQTLQKRGAARPVLRLGPCSGDTKQPQTTAASQASHQATISWQLKEERQLPTQTATHKSITWAKPDQLSDSQLEEKAIHLTNVGRGVCAAELWAPQHLCGDSLLLQTPTTIKLLPIPKILSAW